MGGAGRVIAILYTNICSNTSLSRNSGVWGPAVYGCRSVVDGPGGLSGQQGLAESREQVRSEIVAIADELLASARVQDDGGGVDVCGSAPAEGVQYSGGITFEDDGGPLPERVAQAREVYEERGWQVSSEDVSPQGVDRVTFERDDLRGSVGKTALRGSDAMTFDVAGPCIPTSDDETDQLLGPSEPLLP